MKLASTNKDIDPERERFFFAHDETLSYVAEQKFGEQSDDEEDDEEEEEECDVTLAKHLIVTVNRGKDFDSVILEKNKQLEKEMKDRVNHDIEDSGTVISTKTKDEFLDNFKSISVST